MVKLKVADAAFCVGTTPQSIRKWLQKGQVRWLATSRSEPGEIATFGVVDLLRMKVMVVAIDYGATVREAAEIAVFGNLLPAEFQDDDISRLRDFFDVPDMRIIITRKGQFWTVAIDDRKNTLTPAAALILQPRELFGEVLDRAEVLHKRRAA